MLQNAGTSGSHNSVTGATARCSARPRAGRFIGALRRRRGLRRGSAIVELAVVTPLLLTMIFGIMEFGWVFMFKETLTNATREAARVRVLQGSTDLDAQNRFVAALRPALSSASTSMVNITLSGDIYTVQATVPYSAVSLCGVGEALGRLMGDSNFISGNLTATCSMRREGA